MKKLLLSMALLSVSALGFAQSAKIGIKGGVNFANVSSSLENVSPSLGTLTTYSVGVFADLKLGLISLQPGIYYTGKGFDGHTSSTDQRQSLKYVEIPVDIVYHIPAVVGNVYFGAGPYLAMGVGGKTKYRSGGISIDNDITFGGGTAEVKKIDYGVQGIAGFEFKRGLLIGVNYDLGLTDIYNYNSYGATTKNRVFGVSVGYTF